MREGVLDLSRMKTAATSLSQFRLTTEDWVRVGLGLLVLGLVFYAYMVQKVNSYEMTAYEWLYGHWKRISHYSHGPLIPLIAVGLAVWKREEVGRARWQGSRWGLGILLFASFLYYAGVKAEQERAVVISFVLMLYGLVLALAGRELLRSLFFPISFLFLMIPLNFLEERVAVPLRHIVAYVSTVILNGLGIEAMKVGTGIHSSVFRFDVANPCSGIQSLMALTTVTAAYAYVTQQSQWKRWVLFLSALPLAVLGNFVRVVGIALIAQNYGTETAMKIHDSVAGFIVFAVALGTMVLIGWCLSLNYRRIWSNWTKPTPAGEPKHE